ncbi:MAG: hypothetical protein HDS65_10895 [Bacteroidales bacterium]|nr:hypothetical protein [Bacteroidales bacterium]
MRKGIICLETGEFEKYRTEDQFKAQPLLEFMKQAKIIDDYIYRQIATRQELEYYLKKIGDKHYLNKYGVVYFSFHGEPENICLSQNGKNNVSFEDIAEMVAPYDSFKDRHIHFSSCETLNCEDAVIKQFKRNTGAKSVSGYTEEVDVVGAFINELAYFHQIFSDWTMYTVKKHMSDYQKQLCKLGFTIL